MYCGPFPQTARASAELFGVCGPVPPLAETIASSWPEVERSLQTAGKTALRLQKNISFEKKDADQIVSEADLVVQEQLSKVLATLFPDLPLYAEEGAAAAPPSETYLTLDPIDGTANYIAAAKEWGITVAAVIDGSPFAGATFLPAKKTLYSAIEGQGCKRNGKLFHLPTKASLPECLVGVELGRFLPQKHMPVIDRLRQQSQILRNAGCSVANTADLLSGVTGAFLHIEGGKVWDHAAAAVLVREAGGIVSSPSGGELRWDTMMLPALFSQNETIHGQIVDLIREG